MYLFTILLSDKWPITVRDKNQMGQAGVKRIGENWIPWREERDVSPEKAHTHSLLLGPVCFRNVESVHE